MIKKKCFPKDKYSMLSKIIMLLALASAFLIDAVIHTPIYREEDDVELEQKKVYDNFKHFNPRAVEYRNKYYYYEKDGINDTMGFLPDGLLKKITDEKDWKDLKEAAKRERFKRFKMLNPKAYEKDGKMYVEGFTTGVYDLEGLARDGLLEQIWSEEDCCRRF